MSKHPLGITALLTSLFGRHTDIARFLVERGADVNIARGGSSWSRAGWTALHYSAGLGFVDLIEFLTDHGANINAKDETGATAVQIAHEGGRYEIANLLLKRGAL